MCRGDFNQIDILTDGQDSFAGIGTFFQSFFDTPESAFLPDSEMFGASQRGRYLFLAAVFEGFIPF